MKLKRQHLLLKSHKDPLLPHSNLTVVKRRPLLDGRFPYSRLRRTDIEWLARVNQQSHDIWASRSFVVLAFLLTMSLNKTGKNDDNVALVWWFRSLSGLVIT